MKIAKEVWLVVAIIGFLLSWLIDRLGGPVSIVVGNPIAFLRSSTLLNTYPFTAAAMLIRAFAIAVSVMLVISLLERRYFAKAVIILFGGILAEFYAIQQLTTGARLTTIQWTLAIAYASLALALGVIAMVLKGIWATFNNNEVTSTQEPTGQGEEESSILEPPKEE